MKLTGKIAKQGLEPFIERPALRGGRKAPRIWIMVADKAIARLFRKPDGHLELIGEARPRESLRTELANKNAGRIASSAGSGMRHRLEAHMEQTHQDELLFAHDIADWLDKMESVNAFDRLVLIAAPHTLGNLRAVISPPVQSRIAAEVNKDLTKLDETALRDALDEIVWF